MMHLLSLSRVKKKLIKSSYSENTIFLNFFIVTFGGLMYGLISEYTIIEDEISLEHVLAINLAQIVFSSVGLFFCFVANKGRRGKNFLEVFYSIAVPWGLRALLIAIPFAFVFLLISQLLVNHTPILEVDDINISEQMLDGVGSVVVEILLELVFWSGMILHIRDISRCRQDPKI